MNVDMWSKPRTYLVLGVVLIGLFLLYQLWVWEVERVEVAPNTFLVKINRWGKDLPEGEIVAPDDSYKGIQRKVLTEGRHFLNPILYGYEKCTVLQVPEGKCAVLTRKAGTEIPSSDKARGAFLADGDFDQFADREPGQRGILAKVLPPGKYYVNPYEYSHELVNAVEVRADQVGVRVLKWGLDPRAQVGQGSAYVVPVEDPPFRGVQNKPLEPATYYINPYVEEIVPVSIRSHPVEFSDIYFPSRDGFLIQPHVLVAYKVIPEMAPELFVMLCDDGRLPQAGTTPEEQKKNPILQKVVLPLIRGYVRIEGSKYDAREYVSQQRDAKDEKKVNPREKLQEELMKKVAPACKKVGVIIETITVAQPEMNKDLDLLADAISQREQTRLTREKNKQLVLQHKQEQEQQAKEALAQQRTKVVDANTKLEQEKINALRRKEVEVLKLEASLKAAQERFEGAKKRAEATVTEGKAEAAVIEAKNEAEVAGLKTAVGGFPSPEQYAQYEVVKKLAPALSEIFASDTSEFAKVFSTYMSPARAPAAAAGGKRTADAKKTAE
jgi:hypothetical protein